MEALISSTIPNFVNGVSQQPFTLRLNSQGEAQENGLSTVAQGLKKRPPTKHIKKILSTALSNAFIHTINRDLTEQYIVIIANGDLKVYDLLGVEKTVNFPEGKGYLVSTRPDTEFSAVTVADYTFVVNKTVTVKQSTLHTPKRPYEAIVNIKSGNYGKTYKVNLNDVVVATYTTPDGSSPSHSANISTDFIGAQLESSFAKTYAGQAVTDITWLSYNKREYVTSQSTAGGMAGFLTTTSLETVTYFYGAEFTLPSGASLSNTTVYLDFPVDSARGKVTRDKITATFTNISGTRWKVLFAENAGQPTITSLNSSANILLKRNGSVLYFYSNADFSITVEDGFNNNAMVAVKGETQFFNDLPSNNGFNGVVVKVIGDPETSGDDYYAEYTTDEGGGVWKETVASDISVGLYDDSMPWVLVRTSNGEFNFYSPEWGKRTVGDYKTAADPSFVNKKISDVFFYRNRLGFLCDESISFSENGEFFSFYPKTVTALLDADRIDVTTAHTKVANLKHAINFNKQLLIFSEQTQFIVEDTDLLTPKNISVKVSTEFPCNVNAKPVGVGKNVYFVADKDSYSQVREYFPDSNNYNYDSLDVTSHLPKYIPSNVNKLTAAPNEDTLIALSPKEPNAIYVYKFFWSNTEKLQSSWSKFTLGSEASILNADFIQSHLLLVVNRADGVYLETMNLSLGAVDGDEPFYVHLDRKKQLTSASLTYDAGYTVINQTLLGYKPQYGNHKLVINSGIGLKAGTILDVVWDGTNAKVLGNYTGATATFGQSYTFTYQLSPIVMKTTTASGAQKSDTEGRLQIRKVSFNFADTGFFQVQVTPIGRDMGVYNYSGKVLGEVSGTVGQYHNTTGRYQVPILSRNTTVKISLTNDSPLPSSFLSADWEGMYVKRSRQV